ncbi:MAG: Asp-tRNA(Asn)/Glu-tRNA(Gln) amidotransferase subunit GatC [Eubacteriales bacterium]
MAVTKEQVKYIASLAKLEIEEKDLDAFTKEMEQIIEFADSLNKIDTEGIEPTAHIQGIENVLRKDSEPVTFGTEKLLENAPEKVDTCFSVPKVVE